MAPTGQDGVAFDLALKGAAHAFPTANSRHSLSFFLLEVSYGSTGVKQIGLCAPFASYNSDSSYRFRIDIITVNCK
jgi:hypothetical protein